MILNNEILIKFGMKIKQWRNENSYSQVDLASEVGFNISYIRLIEAGQINISFLRLLRLSKVMGVRPEELVKDL